ncbi:CHAT domain-containing protein [Acidipila rosea]|jgi:CHAT domain-containing protein|nr:CHAT domain-containing tetratricopeptide repeat protein [Acidipila rosea]MBN9617737.1 CHAT domain-containing protein [Terriglobales bacterium]HZY62820.1 CHAT domain-containing tetratricopeptide repeat protein [Edaphobacter sp.]
MSWLNSWIAAEPLYRQAEIQFAQKHQLSRALYARVSEMPAHSESSAGIPAQISILIKDLKLPEARDPETRLRVLTILGMLEVNYDSGMARETWTQVENLALRRHHYLLASRAVGEQGIAAFLLGDMATAKKDVVKAWIVAKTADPAAHIRYASMYGTGLVELHKYKEALGPLNEAINVAKDTPGAAYPTIAITAKIGALSGLGKGQEALTLAGEEMERVGRYHLVEHLADVYQIRAGVYEAMGNWDQAVSDYRQSAQYAKKVSHWRGLTQVDGLLAKAYLHQGALESALAAINEAIEANERIPDELYFVPKNLAIKADIMAKRGNIKSSNQLYEKSADMLDALLSKVPTPTVERQLLSDLSEVYSEYFTSLSNQGRTAAAFHVIERARGRVEAQALTHHEVIAPHDPNLMEQRLTKLNFALLNTDEPTARGHILDAIYQVEQQLTPNSAEVDTAPEPVDLRQLQRDLRPSELFVEYVLDSPQSYALAVTHQTVHRYTLPSKDILGQQVMRYRSEILQQKNDQALAQQLFNALLGGIQEFKDKQTLIVVPDGKLHLLPFSALENGGHYILTSHLVTVVPSGTVLDILRHRTNQMVRDDLPYLGVAAWTTNSSSPSTLLTSIRRAVSGPDRKELVALPESQHEVETIASDLPKPNTVLLGSRATETNFKSLPLSHYKVVHLALHGYVDPVFSDRSALIFAPEPGLTDDSLLQVREIRKLHFNANLVTLSACNTSVGQIGEEGAANIVNAFIEAGSQSVVSTFWELEDHATTHLMTVFYEHLGRHEEKAEALRQAQLEMLNSGSPPYYWAAFVLNGEPNGSLFSAPDSNLSSRSIQ